MTGGLLIRYADLSMSSEQRLSSFVRGEKKLTWVSLLPHALPKAEIFLVGGTVRDVLLGKYPKDIDVVIRGVESEKLEKWLKTQGACEFVGRSFGTFKFAPHGISGKDPIDIALPRSESIGQNHKSGRKDMDIKVDYQLPIEDDLSRRDFTINAMAFNLMTEELVDPFFGKEDLGNGVIRAVGEASERFFEDATRILRALRFASQYRFSIEEYTWEALQRLVTLLNKKELDEEGGHIYTVAREAIGREFLLGFVDHPVHTLHLWQKAGALKELMPEINHRAAEELDGIVHIFMKPNFYRPWGLSQVPATVLVAAFLAETAKDREVSAHLCRRFYFHQFPKYHHAFVNCFDIDWILTHLTIFQEKDPARMRPSVFERYFLNDRGRMLLMLMQARFVARGEHSLERERLHVAKRIMMSMLTCDGSSVMPKLISGKDIKNLGVEPGPLYRQLLDEVRDLQLIHEIHLKGEALVFLKKRVQELGIM